MPLRTRTIVLIGSIAALTGIGLMSFHRYGYEAAPEVPLIGEIKRSTDSTYPFELGFIQFGDDGRFRDQSQLDALVRRIRREAQSSGAVIVLFAHGWNNTCAECREEVECFKRQLAFISHLQSLYAPVRRVFGIYIGWNGVRLRPEHFNLALTFEDRRDVADRIGASGDLRKAVVALSDLRKSLDRKSVFIASGHSLGARALFKAMTENGKSIAGLEKISDLIVLLNPALSAEDYAPIDREAAQLTVTTPEPPKMLVLSSESDYVTQMIYPFSVDRQWLVKLANDEQLDRYTTVGNFSGFYTHRLTLTKGQPRTSPQTGEHSKCECNGFQSGDFNALIAERKASNSNVFNYTDLDMPGGADNGRFRVKLVSLGVERGPYAVVQVDRRLMNGHGGIYTPTAAELLARIANARFFRK